MGSPRCPNPPRWGKCFSQASSVPPQPRCYRRVRPPKETAWHDSFLCKIKTSSRLRFDRRKHAHSSSLAAKSKDRVRHELDADVTTRVGGSGYASG
jgi:hypothetical protein